MIKIAIIGAGISGLIVASRLKEIADITVFEKSRGIGGRMSTRYFENYEFDHGAQYFTARSIEFQNFLKPYLDQGIIKKWHPKVITLNHDQKPYKRDWFEPHFVAAPKMNSLCKDIAKNLNLKLNTQMTSLSRVSNKWQLTTNNGEVFEDFDWVISAAPAPQTYNILPVEFNKRDFISKVKMTSCYTLMLGLSKLDNINFDAADVNDSPIEWIAINSTKPGRSLNGISIVAQTSEVWSEKNIEEDQEILKDILLEELSSILNRDLSNYRYINLHRWRYARAGQLIDPPNFLLDINNQLAACGDWCISGRV